MHNANLQAAVGSVQAVAEDLGRRARQASRQIALVGSDAKNRWLKLLADRLRSQTRELLSANEMDVEAAHRLQLAQALLDRLRLDPERIKAMATGLEELAALDDPVAELIETRTRPNGLRIDKVRVPLGVILFIYESRPNVTTDAAGICVKSGNAVILRGGSEAVNSNRVICQIVRETLVECGLPADAVQWVASQDRELIDQLLHQPEFIDLAIPRGGEDLIRRVAAEARMPVMKHFKGICHVYVHAAADFWMAREIVLNSKCQRPGVCNAAECLLVDRAIAPAFLPSMIDELRRAGVEIRGCLETCRLAPGVVLASDRDYATEYLDLKLSVRVVDGMDQAIEHIARFGSTHTETIVTRDPAASNEFTRRVDSSVVMVNASTRFNDGGEFGLGAEIGISTDKYHARGPCGLRELTSYKYIVHGTGQLRI